MSYVNYRNRYSTLLYILYNRSSLRVIFKSRVPQNDPRSVHPWRRTVHGFKIRDPSFRPRLVLGITNMFIKAGSLDESSQSPTTPGRTLDPRVYGRLKDSSRRSPDTALETR